MQFRRPVAIVFVCVLTALAAVGCDSGPRAPALSDSPVYENRQAGCRFLAPEGWHQSVNSALPANLDREFRLVEYTTLGASFEVICIDDPSGEHEDQHAYHAGPSYGVQSWSSVASPEEAEVNGAPCVRLMYEAEQGGQKTVKQVAVFKRKSRYYSFVALYRAELDKVGQQVNRVVDSTVWRD